MELSPKTMEDLIHEAFPEAIVVSHHPLESESASQNYILELKSPSGEITLRIYPPDMPQHTIEKEMHILRVVMPETGVPTARVIHWDNSRTVIDHPYAILNLLPGEPLQKALPRMDELDKETVGYEMGRYLAKLHSIPLPTFGQFLSPDPRASISEKAYTVAQVIEWLTTCEDHNLLEESAISHLRRFMGQTRVLDRERACFVHGSYHERNINVEEGVAGFHVTGVFNFEHAQGWSPEWDMANLYGYVFDDHPALVKGFLDGYADTAKLPENLWHRLEVYQQVMNVRQLVYAHSAGDESSLKAHQARVHRSLEKPSP